MTSTNTRVYKIIKVPLKEILNLFFYLLNVCIYGDLNSFFFPITKIFSFLLNVFKSYYYITVSFSICVYLFIFLHAKFCICPY